MRREPRLLPALGLFSLASCASYEARPLLEREVLHDLQSIRLESLAPVPEPPRADGEPPAFDPSDGLTPDEALAVALFLNPDLRAFRKERGVAEGELISASLFENPRLDLSWQYIEHFTESLGTSAIDLGLSWTPPRPGERDARTSRAQARIEEVRAEIASEEVRVAAEVRKAFLALLAGDERLRLAGASLHLQERVRQFFRDRRALGDASDLDVNLVDLEYAETLREHELIASERERAQLELNRVLGLPPYAAVKLQADAALLAYRPLALDLGVLEERMVERRPELLAAKYEYEQAEQSLRLACIQSWPWFSIGPAYSRDEIEGRGGNRWGVQLGVELPIANQNQGEIARLTAARDQQHEAFVAKVHAARAELNESYRSLRAQERLLRLYEQSVGPTLEANARLTEAAFQSGQFNLTQLVTTQDKALRSRRAFLEDELDYWRAIFDLERAVGAPLGELQAADGANP